MWYLTLSWAPVGNAILSHIWRWNCWQELAGVRIEPALRFRGEIYGDAVRHSFQAGWLAVGQRRVLRVQLRAYRLSSAERHPRRVGARNWRKEHERSRVKTARKMHRNSLRCNGARLERLTDGVQVRCQFRPFGKHGVSMRYVKTTARRTTVTKSPEYCGLAQSAALNLIIEKRELFEPVRSCILFRCSRKTTQDQ